MALCKSFGAFVTFKTYNITFKPVTVAARSKTQVYGRSPAAIMGSNPIEGMDVCLLCVLCVAR
jgi:hypothetical protein